MKTRRKSRKGTEAEAEQEAESQQAEESQPPSPSQPSAPRVNKISIPIPSSISLEELSNLLPEVSLNFPTTETIIHAYRLVLAQATDISNANKQLEDVRAQLVRKDVELDQALQDKERAYSQLEQSVGEAYSELKAATQQRDELRASQVALESQLSTINSSQTTRASELEVLQGRVEEVEREKRELVIVMDRLRIDGTQAETETQSLREQLKKTRTELSDVQSNLRAVTSTQTTNRFKIESLELQLGLSTQERDRVSKELDAKIEEFGKYRRERQAEHAGLQMTFDALSHDYEACKADLDNLKRSHQTQQDQLTAAFDKVNSLQDRLAEEGAASRAQSDTQARLIELLEKRNSEAKKRVQDVDDEWDRMMQEHSDREERLKEQLRREKERGDRLDANLTRVLESSDGTMRLSPSNTTPEPSPSANIVAGFMKGTKLSDIFEENRRVKDELQRVKVENVRLTDTTTQLISKVQEMAPQLGEQRVEYERQKAETIQLSHQLSVVLSERDSNLQLARETEYKFKTSQQENALLETQLGDLGRQVQVLLRELEIMRDPGLASIEQEDVLPEMGEGIDSMITNQLVVFQHLPAFQEQYTKHLKIIRELGDKLERVTREQYEEQSQLENQALEEASAALATLQEELENQKRAYEIQLRGFVQERDMYKARLSSQTQAKIMYGGGANGHVEPPPGDPEYETLLADLQRNFDIYRTETGVDMSKLRDELQDAQKETAQLHAALAKANAKIDFHNERHSMLNDSYTRQQTEISNLRRRNEDILNQAHRVEGASHHISEQLAAANSNIERLRHETATLSAEKKLWKSIELRLSEENQLLSKEKSQLSDVMNNINKLHHDLERSAENDRRRLDTQVQLLETQVQDLKSQLPKERELVRHVTLQKEIETKELQVRLDQASRELSATRESLVAADTAKSHLQQRADDLSRQLEAILEKLSVYERRPGSLNAGNDSLEGRNSEEQLQAEVAELRGALKMAQVDNDAAQGHIEQFKNIARASEEAFETVNEAFNDYKRTAEEQLSRKEAEVHSLQERLHVAEAEMSNASNKQAEAQKILETERRKFASDKRTLERTIVDMTNSVANTKVDEVERASLIKIQEDRAMAAEEKYQREVVSHAQSIKKVEDLKQQLTSLQTSAREKQAVADTARSMFATAEVSWKSQREAMEKEIADVNARCRDLSQQNTVLHQHLESVNIQASRIRHAADQPGAEDLNEPQGGVHDATSELRSVVAYLRREKEIVDLQLELNKQENLRLKTQVDQLSRSLEECRATLSEERERAADSVASATQHAELLERINQLNILRESNATLRAECESYRKQTEGLEERLRQLTAEVEPVKEEARMLRAEVECRDQQLERLAQETQQWKDRNQQILSKYDRIDPAEMQLLKDNLNKLETEKADWEKAKAALEAQVAQSDRYKENLMNFRKQYATLINDSKDKMVAFEAEKKEWQSERDSLKRQLLTSVDSSEQTSVLSARLEMLSAEKLQLENSFTQEKARLEALIKTEREKVVNLTRQVDAVKISEDSDKGSDANIQSAVEEAKRVWETEKALINKEKEEASEREAAVKAQNQKLTEDKGHLEASNKKFQQRLAEQMKKQREQQATPTPDVEELVRTRMAEFTARQARDQETAIQSAVAAATEHLRQELQSSAITDRPSTTSDELAKVTDRHQQELKALEERLTEKHAEDIKKAVQSALESVSGKDGSVQVSPDTEAVVKERLEAALKEQEQRLSIAHAQELKTATENGRKEVNTKFMLKEGQLVRALAARKELEERNRDLEARLASSHAVSKQPSQISIPSDTSVVNKVPPATSLPRKPSITTTIPTAASSSASPTQAVRGAARGRGRGVAIRGGAAVATAQAAGRGGVLANVNSAAAASPSGTSILGAASTSAAGKRPRDDTEPSIESPSLAKRLRNAPVTLQRNRHPPSDSI